MYFRHEHSWKDRKYWSKGLLKLEEDVFFDKKDPNDIWGRTTNSWWADQMALSAKDTAIAQEDTYGCPFAWLLGNF